MNLQLIYDGDSLKNHEINPRELSSAILGLDGVLNEANKTLNSSKTRIQVKVKSNLEAGSFKINFKIDHNIVDTLSDLLTSQNTEAIINGFAIIGVLITGTGSLWKFLKFLKNRKPTKKYKKDNLIIIEIDDEIFETKEEVIRLYENWQLRHSLEQMISPLEKNGIDLCLIKVENSEEFFDVKKEEIEYFKCPPAKEVMIDEPVRFNTNLNIISLSFKDKNKWYVNDGQSSFYSTIEDLDFLRRVDDNEEFRKGDILRVLIRREQYLNEEQKLRTEYFIEEVIEHKKPYQQMSLFN
jgi:hypothetical protein